MLSSVAEYPTTQNRRWLLLFIDIHTHIQQHDPNEVPEMVARAEHAGVGAIIVAGVTVASSRSCIELAESFDALFTGVGVHPQDLEGELDQASVDALDRLAEHERVVVMSEVGLDFQPESPDRDVQERALRAQIAVAKRHELPVVWHMRESIPDTLRVLREERVWEVGGAAHYFQGTYEDAKQVLDLGAKISLAKPLLRLRELQEVVARLPLSSIVLETDAYPQPFKKSRDKWTEPKDVPLVAAKLASLHGVSVEEVEEATTRNALAMLGTRVAPVKAALDTTRSRVRS